MPEQNVMLNDPGRQHQSATQQSLHGPKLSNSKRSTSIAGYAAHGQVSTAQGSKEGDRMASTKESIESSSYGDESEDEFSDYDSETDSDYDSEEESSSEFEENSEVAEQDAADCEALGVDLMRFLKKTEFEHYRDKLKEKMEDLEGMIDIVEMRLEKEISLKGEQYS